LHFSLASWDRQAGISRDRGKGIGERRRRRRRRGALGMKMHCWRLWETLWVAIDCPLNEHHFCIQLYISMHTAHCTHSV
jgi:hypothetical protein